MNESRVHPLSVEQIVTKIDEAISTQTGDNRIAAKRRETLEKMKNLISGKGRALSEDEKRNCCVIPFIFQELNYDGYDWSNRKRPLGRLENLVDLDVIVWSGGFERARVSDSEFERCRQFWFSVIDWRKGKAAGSGKKQEFWTFFWVAILLLASGLAAIQIFVWWGGG